MDDLLQNIDQQVKYFNQSLLACSKYLKLSICIPAKNEENYILNTLQALYFQKDLDGKLLNHDCYEVLLLCHNCTDSTYKIALAFKDKNPEFNLHILELNSSTINNVGAARRVLMHIAASRLQHNNYWIATTDADTIVQANWVSRILSYPQKIDMLCGKINVNTTGLEKGVINLLKAKQKYNALKTQLKSIIIPDANNPWPKHNNNSGPNMALRKHVYLSVNGIPAIAFLEDIALFKRAKSFGYQVRHTNELVVETSGRLLSKTQLGLGSELKHWTTNYKDYKVEPHNSLLKRFRLYKEIKALYYHYSEALLDEIAAMDILKDMQFKALYHSCALYEECIIKVEEALENSIQWNMENPIQNIFEVNKELEDYILSIHSTAYAKALIDSESDCIPLL